MATARGHVSIRRSRFHPVAALRIILQRASREARGFVYGGSREVRIVSITHPNKPMHPTADTTILKFLLSLGAAGDWRRWAASEAERWESLRGKSEYPRSLILKAYPKIISR